jgi:hypothetical protein
MPTVILDTSTSLDSYVTAAGEALPLGLHRDRKEATHGDPRRQCSVDRRFEDGLG